MSDMMTAKERLKALNLGPTRLAELIGVDPSAVSHKLAGRRPWTLEEAQIIAAHVRENHDPDVTIEQLFGAAPAESQEPAA